MPKYISIIVMILSTILLTTCKAYRAEPGSDMLGGQGLGSGNGGLGQHYARPWFPDNAPVHYCIQHERTNFTLPLADARQMIHDALADWVDAIAWQRSRTSGNSVPLARDFLESTTCESADLVFRLGVVDDETRSRLQGWDELDGIEEPPIAFTIPRALPQGANRRTQGEIWFTPDDGPDRYRGQGAIAQIVERFWSYETAFFNVLLHEIGHIYGFRHGSSNLMHGRLPQFSTSLSTHPQPRLSAMDLFRLNPLHQPESMCKMVGPQRATLDAGVLSTIFGIESSEQVYLCIKAVSEESWVYGGREGSYELLFVNKNGDNWEALSAPYAMEGYFRGNSDVIYLPEPSGRGVLGTALSFAKTISFRGKIQIDGKMVPAVMNANSVDCSAELAFYTVDWQELLLRDRDFDQLCGLGGRL